MASGITLLVQPLRPAATIAPRLDPTLVEVMVPYPVGSADRAVAAAMAAVERLLTDVALTGEPTAPTPLLADDSPQIANTEFVQAVVRLALGIAQERAEVIAAGAVADLVRTPGRLSAMLPTSEPATPDTPWRDGDVIAFTPSA